MSDEVREELEEVCVVGTKVNGRCWDAVGAWVIIWLVQRPAVVNGGSVLFLCESRLAVVGGKRNALRNGFGGIVSLGCRGYSSKETYL